ncbi:MAG: acyl-CoA thioesterase [marine bacterium B5-7]|nr:MAG: acyl-CoA thioesterase [marine bacterium B5-7]
MSDQQARGELLSQTIAMPRDGNVNGEIFGGWLVSQMDISAAILSRHTSKGRTTTVAIESVIFKKPVQVGDCVMCFGELEKIGRTSMHIRLELWVKRFESFQQEQVAEGVFVFVAIDENGKPRPIEQANL